MTLPELLALAEKATPGPWPLGEYEEHLGYDCMTGGICVGPSITLDQGDYGQDLNVPDEASRERMIADAAYIAACSPELVATLVRCVGMADELRREGMASFRAPIIAEGYDAARAELDRVMEGK